MTLLRLATLTALALVAFAANSLLNRAALAEGLADPGAFQALRLASGVAMLAVLARGRAGWWRPSTARAWGAVTLATYMIGFSFAYVSLPAGLGALILFGAVQVTMFAGALAGGERVTPRRWIGATAALIGLAWLLWPAQPSRPDLLASAFMLAAAIGWGVYSLLGRGASDPLATTAGNFLYALPLGLLAWAVAGDGITTGGAALAVIAGALTSGVGYAIWYAALPHLKASSAALLQLTVPVIAILGGALLLGEDITLRLLSASALILGGIAWSLRQG
ncbi:MAG: DMT family transporter [Shimia sp.]